MVTLKHYLPNWDDYNLTLEWHRGFALKNEIGGGFDKFCLF